MRNDYLSWDEYFMGIALLSSKRSKDEQTQVGACIVNPDQRIVGIGYNGLPFGCADTEYPWEREGEFLDTKYPYVVHAEANAILNSTRDLKDCTIYITLFPCHECAKLIIQSGIKTIIYMEDKYIGTESNTASKRMLASSGVKTESFKKIQIDLFEV
jgi:dCMP deaminase